MNDDNSDVGSDFDTAKMRVKVTERWQHGYWDPREDRMKTIHYPRMKTVPDLIAYIEGRFPCVPFDEPQHRLWRFCPTGEPYVTIGYEYSPEDEYDPGTTYVHGVIREGKRAVLGYDEETTVVAMRDAFDFWAKDKNGTLYWRYRDKAVLANNGRRGVKKLFRLNMRLLISDRPVLAHAA